MTDAQRALSKAIKRKRVLRRFFAIIAASALTATLIAITIAAVTDPDTNAAQKTASVAVVWGMAACFGIFWTTT